MFTKYKVNKKYILIAIIGLIALWYLLKPKTEFEACYEKCIKTDFMSRETKEALNKVIRESSDEAIDDLINKSLEEESKESICLRICSQIK